MDKAKADEIDKQIRGTWGDFTDSLACEGLEKQIADLRNGAQPNLTAAQRDAREQALEAQKKRDCP
jgi:hypothetical protein